MTQAITAKNASALQEIQVVRQEDICVITLNRPQARNALTTLMADELVSEITTSQKDGTKVIILTAAAPSFCSGGDLNLIKELGEGDTEAATKIVYGKFQGIIKALLNSNIPIICAINGPAIGAGLDLALASDIRIASKTATFSSAWIKRGLTTGLGGAWLLPRAIGATKAAEMLLLGNTKTAEWAEQAGLVTQIVDPENLLNISLDMAKTISKYSADAVIQTRMSLRRSLDAGLLDELTILGKAQGRLLSKSLSLG